MSANPPYKGAPEPRVSDILSAMIGKDGLAFGAAGETARYFLNHPDAHQGQDPDRVLNRARSHFRGVWDTRAAAGTAVHEVNEAWTRGEQVDLELLVNRLAGTDARLWQGREDEALETVSGLVDGLEKFWVDHSPETIATEQVVRDPGVYIGTMDWRLRLRDRRVVTCDVKSTAHVEEHKGLYLAEWALQTVAYDRTPEALTYKREGTKWVVDTVAPWEPADACVILHLRPNGTYKLYEVPADDRAYDTFVGMAKGYQWLRSLPKSPKQYKEAS